MILLRIPGFFLTIVRAILLSLGILFFLLPYLLLSSFLFKHTPARAFKLRRAYINYALFIFGIKIEKSGEVYDKPALFVCNHRTLSDPIPVLKYLDAYVIAKAEVANYPVINKGAEVTGIIYVKRDSKDSRRVTRQAMINTVKNGYNVLVFPEGTTNGHKRTMPYRPGTFFEAANNNIPVVPIALEYRSKWDLWTDQTSLFHQFFKQFWKPLTYTKLKFGEPILSDDAEYIRKTAEDWTNLELEKMQDGWVKGDFYEPVEKA